MTDDELPKVIWVGTFTLFGVDLKCYVLDDGRQIIDEDSLADLFDAMAQPGVPPIGDGLEAFTAWKSGGELK